MKKRSQPIRRSGRPARVNRQRKAKNHERAYGEKRAFVAAMPCLVCGYSPCDPAHVGTAGAGMKSGSERLVPLCGPHEMYVGVFDDAHLKLVDGHHRESHRGIKTFQRKYGIDLKAEAERIEAEWQLHFFTRD